MRKAIAVAFVVALLGACGDGDSGSKGAGAGGGDGTTSTSSAPAPGGAASSTTSSSNPQAGGAPADSRSSATTAPAGGSSSTPDTAVRITVDAPCTMAGGEQSIRVTGVKPGSSVAYDTEYADGTSGINGTYTTGKGRGTADGDGVFATRWTVASEAPPGPTKIHAAASEPSSRMVIVTASFTLKGPGDACP